MLLPQHALNRQKILWIKSLSEEVSKDVRWELENSSSQYLCCNSIKDKKTAIEIVARLKAFHGSNKNAVVVLKTQNLNVNANGKDQTANYKIQVDLSKLQVPLSLVQNQCFSPYKKDKYNNLNDIDFAIEHLQDKLRDLRVLRYTKQAITKQKEVSSGVGNGTVLITYQEIVSICDPNPIFYEVDYTKNLARLKVMEGFEVHCKEIDITLEEAQTLLKKLRDYDQINHAGVYSIHEGVVSEPHIETKKAQEGKASKENKDGTDKKEGKDNKEGKENNEDKAPKDNKTSIDKNVITPLVPQSKKYYIIVNLSQMKYACSDQSDSVAALPKHSSKALRIHQVSFAPKPGFSNYLQLNKQGVNEANNTSLLGITGTTSGASVEQKQHKDRAQYDNASSIATATLVPQYGDQLNINNTDGIELALDEKQEKEIGAAIQNLINNLKILKEKWQLFLNAIKSQIVKNLILGEKSDCLSDAFMAAEATIQLVKIEGARKMINTFSVKNCKSNFFKEIESLLGNLKAFDDKELSDVEIEFTEQEKMHQTHDAVFSAIEQLLQYSHLISGSNSTRKQAFH